jgi:hypothetical protein
MSEPTEVRDRVGIKREVHMLKIVFPDSEYFDNQKQIFIEVKGGTYYFEHSLLAISKWESKFKKPFLTQDEKTQGEWYAYMGCMAFDKNFNLMLLANQDAYLKILHYIHEPQTATRIKPSNNEPSSTYISSELLYANMAQSGIPFEADRWHLSRLMALLGIIAEQNTPADKKRMSNNEVIEYQARLNAERRAKAKALREARNAN